MFSHYEEYNLLLYLAGQSAPRYAIYGAGKFTEAMLAFITDKRLPPPKFVFDDKPSADRPLPVPVIATEKAVFDEIETVILGTDAWQERMRLKISEVCPSVRVLEVAPRNPQAAKPDSEDLVIAQYKEGGMVPWSKGYLEYRNREFAKAINSEETLAAFRAGRLPSGFGHRLDDRIVEYPWLFSRLRPGGGVLLDAGSTLNFDYILDHPAMRERKITIVTLAPEGNCFFARSINYLYEDLRHVPFRSATFDEIACVSTLEHVDMDNTMYGAANETPAEENKKRPTGYMKVMDELVRVLRPGGTLYATVPYGRYEKHGFFQQFDRRMLASVGKRLSKAGDFSLEFFRYFPDGWRFVSQEECDDAESFNPHTGRGKKDDGAAHSRGICAVCFTKKVTTHHEEREGHEGGEDGV